MKAMHSLRHKMQPPLRRKAESAAGVEHGHFPLTVSLTSASVLTGGTIKTIKERMKADPNTTCFEVFEQCVLAVQAGELIESVSAKDKEFHFQNWFRKRLQKLGIHFEGSGRNTYPDFSLVEYTEGYEIKGLAWPGRERD